jgi:hypothetical protein
VLVLECALKGSHNEAARVATTHIVDYKSPFHRARPSGSTRRGVKAERYFGESEGKRLL